MNVAQVTWMIANNDKIPVTLNRMTEDDFLV